MVAHPGEYHWSSFAANSQGAPSALITPHRQYLALGEDAAGRRAAYTDLFRGDSDSDELAEIRTAVNAGYAFGSDCFRKEVEGMTGRRAGRGKPADRPPGPESIRSSSASCGEGKGTGSTDGFDAGSGELWETVVCP